MRERIYRTSAVVLRRTNLGEADRLLLIATPKEKKRVVAKGARKTTSRLAGHIELFTHSTLLLAIGRNLDIITQSAVIHSFAALRGDLQRLSAAYYVADLYDRAVQDVVENRHLFDVLVTTLTVLDTTPNIRLALRWYELRLLQLVGYRPQLYRCTLCQEPLTPEAQTFSPAAGGVICYHHTPPDRHALAIDYPTFKLLRYLQREPHTVIDRLHISDAVQEQAEVLLRTYIRVVLERDAKPDPFRESPGFDRHPAEHALPAPGSNHHASGAPPDT